ncbi:MAG: AraC family transcriptional regulator [Moraxellaceae bacterium]|nr:AraC family transcriptional regulator [Moraxellaceae bacterium]
MLFEYLAQRGHAPEAVLGLPWPTPQADGLGGFPIERWVTLLQRAADHLDDPLLGLHLGQCITPRHVGVLGYVLLASPNLASALTRLERYQRLVYDVTPMQRRDGDGYIDMVWGAEQGRPGRLSDDTSITALVHFCRSLTREPVYPRAVHFLNPAPPDIRPYTAYFGCPVLFEQPETIVRVGIEALAMPLKSADPGLVALLEGQAEQLLAQLPQDDAFIDRLRKAIALALHEGEPAVDTIAQTLCGSARTLQRQLRDAGTSFRQELATVRRQLADRYLADSRLNIADIALLLGYSEHSAFTRGYRQWTGQSPQQARAGMQRESSE